MVSIIPIEGSVLGGARDAAGGYSLYIDVGEVFLNVFGDREGDGCVGYSFAEEPAYALLYRMSVLAEKNQAIF